MAIFPEIMPDYGYKFFPKYKTDRLPVTDGDYSMRRRRRANGLYSAILTYTSKTAEDERSLVDFFDARYGGWDSFIFFDFISRVYPVMSLGTADGWQKVWTLEARDVSVETIYFDGVDNDLFSYTIGNRTGVNGQDQIIFSTAPTDTIVLTIGYSGKKYLPICVFDEDKLETALTNWARNSLGTITILQVNA